MKGKIVKILQEIQLIFNPSLPVFIYLLQFRSIRFPKYLLSSRFETFTAVNLINV